MALNPIQVLFVLYVQNCLNVGLQYTKESALTFAATKMMAPMKTFPVVDFSEATGASQGSPSADWDYLVENNLLPTQPQPQFQPNGLPLSRLTRNQTGKN